MEVELVYKTVSFRYAEKWFFDIFFQMIFYCRLLQDIEYSPLRYTANLIVYLTVLNIGLPWSTLNIHSLEGLVLKLKLQWLIGKDPDAGKDWGQEEEGATEDEMVDGMIATMDIGLSKPWEIVKDREAWRAAVHGATKRWTRLSHWTGSDEWPSGKEPACQCWRLRRRGSSSGSGRSAGNPLRYPCLGNPEEGGAWRATVHGVAKSQTQLSNQTTRQLAGIWSNLNPQTLLLGVYT